MHILFFVTSAPLLRHFASTLKLLTSRGDSLTVAAPEDPRGRGLTKPLADDPQVRLLRFDTARDQELDSAVTLLRLTRDFLRYSTPQLSAAHANRRRVFEQLMEEVRGGTARGTLADEPLIQLDEAAALSLERRLARIESLIPGDEEVDEIVRRLRPDVVLVTPLVTAGSQQVEVVKAARTLGIPCGFPVFSWDNLSNKGTIHEAPDRVFVWNDIQQQEAVELHGIQPSAVSVTGAPRFDAFFEMTPSEPRESFCRRHGLDPRRPILVYVGSSPAVTEVETVIVDRWLTRLRGGPAELREANVLIRPHPRRRDVWEQWPGRNASRVAVSPHPSVHGDHSLYDELHHSAAVVGLNTSAQIEAAIVGRPVYTFTAGDLAPGQEGSTHFGYLLADHGGCVTLASTLDEHIGHLADALAGRFDADAITSFVQSFVRPAGLDRPATPILADAIRDLARTREAKAPFSTRVRLRVGSLRSSKS